MSVASLTESRAQAQAAIALALAQATVVIDTASAGGYGTVAAGETAINAVRTQLHALIPTVCDLWGVDGNAVVRALRAVGVALLDIRALLNDAELTVVDVLDRPSNAILLAVTHYSDFTRFLEIVALNPSINHPGRIPTGTAVVRRAQ